MSPDPSLHVFLHVPKCAGTTFRAHIERNFAYAETIPAYVNFSGFLDLTTGERRVLEQPGEILDYIERLSPAQRCRIRMIYGHHVTQDVADAFDRPARFVTFLRDPVDRLISHYRYHQRVWTGETGDDAERFGRWLASIHESPHWAANPNLMVWCLSAAYRSRQLVSKFEVTESDLERAKKVLDGYYFVGLAESFDEDSLFLFHELGFRYFTGRKHASSGPSSDDGYGAFEERIRELSGFDRRLYEHARELNQRFKEERPDFEQIVARMAAKAHPTSRIGRLRNAVSDPLAFLPWGLRAYGWRRLVRTRLLGRSKRT